MYVRLLFDLHYRYIRLACLYTKTVIIIIYNYISVIYKEKKIVYIF